MPFIVCYQFDSANWIGIVIKENSFGIWKKMKTLRFFISVANDSPKSLDYLKVFGKIFTVGR
jgi:hypothetical protein